MHQHTALAAGDAERRQQDRRVGIVVPLVPRRLLIVPSQAAVLGPDGEQRRQEEVVAAPGASLGAGVDLAVAGGRVQQVELRVIDHPIPDVAAAADVPAAGRVPGPLGDGQIRVIPRLAGIARRGEEAPGPAAGIEVIGGDVATGVELTAGVADDHYPAGDLRRAGGGVAAAMVDDGVGAPDDFAGGRVQGVEHPVQRRHIDPAPPDRHAPVDLVAAGGAMHARVDLWLEPPDQLAAPRIEGIGAAGHTRGVHHPIDDDGRRLQSAVRIGVEAPGVAQARDAGGVDLGQARIVGLAEVAAGGEPLLGVSGRGQQPPAIDGRRPLLAGREQQQEGDEARPRHERRHSQDHLPRQRRPGERFEAGGGRRSFARSALYRDHYDELTGNCQHRPVTPGSSTRRPWPQRPPAAPAPEDRSSAGYGKAGRAAEGPCR